MTSEASNIGMWILAAIAVLEFVVLLNKVGGRGEPRTIGPQPLVVKAEPQSTTVDICNERHEQLNEQLSQFRSELKAMDERHTIRTESLRREMKADTAEIYSRLNGVERGIRESIEALGVRIGEICGEMKRIGGRS